VTDQNALAQVNIDFTSTFGKLAEGVAVVDMSRRIAFVNDAITTIFGYTREELLGRSPELIYLSNKDYKSTGAERFNGTEAAIAAPFQMQYRRKNGEIFTAETVGTILYDGKATPLGYLTIVRDISDRIAMESKAKQAMEVLEDAIESIDEGFALYGEDDRLVICNSHYKAIYPKSVEAMVPGNSFRDIIKYGLEKGEYDQGNLSSDAWLEERLRRHNMADGSRLEQKLSDGRWLQIAEKRTRSGGIAGVRSDITKLKEAQEKLSEAYTDIEVITNSLPCTIYEIEPDGTCIFANRLGAEWFATTPDEIIGTKLKDAFGEKEWQATIGYFKNALMGAEQHFEAELTLPDGVPREVSIDFLPKIDSNRNVVSLIAFGTDISDQKKIERTLAGLYRITSTRQIDAADKIQMIMGLGCAHFGLPFGIVSRIEGDKYTVEYAESPAGELEAGVELPLDICYCSQALDSEAPLAIEHTKKSVLAKHPCYAEFGLEAYIGAQVLVDGDRYGTVNFTGPEPRKTPFTQTDRELIRQFADWIGNELARERDILRLKEAKEKMERIASIDDLTGIYNRRAFLARAETELSRYRRNGTIFTVLLIDLDHFKSINDRFGHAAGDEVLRRMAAAVKGELRAVDVFGRFGGEEFCIVLNGTAEPAALQVAERIRHKIIDNCSLKKAGRTVTASIGVAGVSHGDEAMSTVIQRADKALYAAKNGGRNRTILFDARAIHKNTSTERTRPGR